MKLELHGGSGTQRAWFREAFYSCQRRTFVEWEDVFGHRQVADFYKFHPLAHLPVIVEVFWVADPLPGDATELALTVNEYVEFEYVGSSTDFGVGGGEVTMRPEFVPGLEMDPDVDGPLPPKLKAPHSTIRIKNGIESNKARYLDVVRHELGHVAHSGTTEAAKSLICALFGRPEEDWNNPALPWGQRVLEASCETFKDVFWDRGQPKFSSNRTALKLPEENLASWIEAVSPARQDSNPPGPNPMHGKVYGGFQEWLSQPGREAVDPDIDLPLQEASNYKMSLLIGTSSLITGAPYVWWQRDRGGGYEKQWHTGNDNTPFMLGPHLPTPAVGSSQEDDEGVPWDPYPIDAIWTAPYTGIGTFDVHFGEGVQVYHSLDFGDIWNSDSGGLMHSFRQDEGNAEDGIYPNLTVNVFVTDADTGLPCLLRDEIETDGPDLPPLADHFYWSVTNVWDADGDTFASGVFWEGVQETISEWNMESVLGSLCSYEDLEAIEIVNEQGEGTGKYRWRAAGEFSGRVRVSFDIAATFPYGFNNVGEDPEFVGEPSNVMNDMTIGVTLGLSPPGSYPPYPPPDPGTIQADIVPPGTRPRKPTVGAPAPEAVMPGVLNS